MPHGSVSKITKLFVSYGEKVEQSHRGVSVSSSNRDLNSSPWPHSLVIRMLDRIRFRAITSLSISIPLSIAFQIFLSKKLPFFQFFAPKSTEMQRAVDRIKWPINQVRCWLLARPLETSSMCPLHASQSDELRVYLPATVPVAVREAAAWCHAPPQCKLSGAS